jgi:hypothetical protein
MKIKRWKLIALVICGLLIAFVCWYLFAPTPRPNVSLKILRIANLPQHTMIVFTNEGKNPVWWDGTFKMIPEGASGNSSNIYSGIFSDWPRYMPSKSSFTLSLNTIPKYHDPFRVVAAYRRYKRRPLRLETEEHLVSRCSKWFAKFEFWFLNHLPNDSEFELIDVSTDVITNNLPVR